MRWLADQPTLKPSVRVAARIALRHLVPRPKPVAVVREAEAD